MAFHVRHPVWISSATGKAAWAFAALFFLESIARSSVATVFPLHAYALFGNKETVSIVYTSVAFAALFASFLIPYLIRLLSRRWSYTLGAVSVALCGVALAFDNKEGQVAAMFLRTFGAATLNVSLNLYIMDHIRKSDLVHTEPLRYAVSTLAWIVTPLAGVWLYQHYGVVAASLIPPVSAALLLAVFWYLRLSEKGPIRPGRILPPNPFASIGRFVAQPRLRLAWLIAFGRSSFWVTFFIYVPILMLEGNAGPLAGGIAIAAGNAMLFNNLLVAGWAKRYSLRIMIALDFMAAAFLVIAAGIAGTSHAIFAGTMMVLAAFFISMLDGLGPIPFLRAVRAHERPQMTTVYRTYLDASELIPPFIYVFAFMAFGFSGAFYVLATLFAVTGLTVLKYLPRQM
ncbi:MAG: MFS transporter [Nitratireductor sp.]|nr:MFS transporter [Nitratireductor sp.]MCB1459859.1 MFS transporter [Nitratireductor sp.]